jgi:hypothetical protein
MIRKAPSLCPANLFSGELAALAKVWQATPTAGGITISLPFVDGDNTLNRGFLPTMF